MNVPPHPQPPAETADTRQEQPSPVIADNGVTNGELDPYLHGRTLEFLAKHPTSRAAQIMGVATTTLRGYASGAVSRLQAVAITLAADTAAGSADQLPTHCDQQAS
ncbi:hypothetical protein [Kitasatospora sp. NPDC087315]|uniref:hypothetical protein n=1 Tax=Kitasatospora sp. NPDC087315 TaxID=3364069 RepID=UPI0038149EEE